MADIFLTVEQQVFLSTVLQALECPSDFPSFIWQQYIDQERSSIDIRHLAMLVDMCDYNLIVHMRLTTDRIF